MLVPWKKSYDQPRERIKRQRHYFANKGPFSQGYVFFSSHVWMWELDYKESLAPKNWCFWTVVWRRLLRVPWTARRSNQSILKRSILGVHWKDWCWSWNSNTLATSCEELTHWKRPWCWEGLRAGGEGDDRDGMAGWHHQLNGHGFGWTLGIGDWQGGLVCCDSWGHKELDMTERLNWNELNSVPSVMSDSATLCTIAHQAPLSMDSPGRNNGVDCHALLQGIFWTRGSNLYLQHCRWLLYPPSHLKIYLVLYKFPDCLSKWLSHYAFPSTMNMSTLISTFLTQHLVLPVFQILAILVVV